jgi:PAS domain S-box-containing protein
MNNRLLAVLLNSIVTPISLINSDGRIAFLNQAALDLLGLQIATVENRYFWDIAVQPEQAESVANAFNHAISTGVTVFTIDLPLKLATDEMRWLRWTISTVSDSTVSDSTVSHNDRRHDVQMLAVGIDITNLKRAQDELLWVNSQLHIALDAGQTSVWELDVEAGTFHFVHREANVLTDQSLPNIDLHSLMTTRFGPGHESDVVSKVAQLHEVLKGWKEDDILIENYQTPIQGYSNASSPQWVQSSGRVVKNMQGRLSVIGISTNITNRANC